MQNQFTTAIVALIAIATDEEATMSIDEARGIIARAVEAELTEMDVDFDAADLGDWLAAGQFSGNETAVSIAREYAA